MHLYQNCEEECPFALMPELCKFCGYYSFEGRRGGTCERLNALVCGQKPACCFAIDPFAVFPHCSITPEFSIYSPSDPCPDNFIQGVEVPFQLSNRAGNDLPLYLSVIAGSGNERESEGLVLKLSRAT